MQLLSSLKKHLCVLLLLATILVVAGKSVAQTNYGGIRGLVVDSQQAVIPNAQVVLLNEGTRVTRTATSNGAGAFNFTALDPGTYTVSIDLPGFKKFQEKGLVVELGVTSSVEATLSLGAVGEVIEVSGSEPLLNTASSTQGQLFDQQKLQNLPNLGRNPFMFAAQDNNVAVVGDPRYVRFEDQSGQSTVSIAGGPVQANNYSVDGVPITDSTNRAVIIPSIEAVSEAKLQAASFDAEVGRTGGGMYNTVLKSGSNQLHGTLTGLTRQTNWTANLFFNNRTPVTNGSTIISATTPRPASETYTYAGAIGGPVVIPHLYNGRDKTFFWIAEEGYRQAQPLAPATAQWVPTVAERAGDFTAAGEPKIYDPTAPLSGASRATQVSCVMNGVPTVNCIPASYLNQIGLNIAKQYPLPTVPLSATTYGANNFFGADDFKTRADEFDGKIDHQIFSWWHAAVSYMHYGSKEPSGNILHVGPENYTLLFRKVDAVAANTTVTVNPTTVVTAGFGFNRFPNNTFQADYPFDQTSLGLPSALAQSLPSKTFPSVTLFSTQLLGGANSGPSDYYSRNFVLGVSKSLGKHTLKAGYVFRSISNVIFSQSGGNGSYTFNGQYTSVGGAASTLTSTATGSAVADLLMGLPSAASATIVAGRIQFNTKYNAIYVQDDYRLTQKLTVNLGLRYENEPGIHEINNSFAVGFDRNVANPIGTAASYPTPGGVMFAGQNGYGHDCCHQSNLKFAPRIGFAYAVTPQTVVHGGYGVFYAPVSFSASSSYSPGYSQTTTAAVPVSNAQLSASSVGGSALLSNPFPSGLLAPSGNANGYLTAIGSSLTLYDQYKRSPIVDQYSADVQQEFPYGIVFKIAYVGSHGRNLQNVANINQVPDSYLSNPAALQTKVANPYYGHGGSGSIGASQINQSVLDLPFPEFSTITMTQSTGYSNYNSMSLKLQKQFHRGLTVLATYTWASNWDNEWGSSNTLNPYVSSNPQDVYNLKSGEYARALDDIPNRFTTSLTYTLPFGRSGMLFTGVNRWVDMMIGGWDINDVTIIQNGMPLPIVQTNSNSSYYGQSYIRPTLTGIGPCYGGSPEGRLGAYLNKAGFTSTPAFSYGNAPRTVNCFGPGYANNDISVNKSFSAGERAKIQFRAEALNAFNTPQFNQPNMNYSSGSFGSITSTLGFSRIIQMGGRITF